ncbi:MAG: amino acid synthesis family protein [Candidatus Limnocylindria bacterium]
MKKLEIRRVVTIVEDRLVDNGRAIDPPTRIVATVAVIENPWHGRGFVDELKPEIDAHAPVLGELLARRLLEAIGGKARMEAYGKGAMVGLGGELEHAVALVHTLKFGNAYRELSGGSRLLKSCDKRGAAGSGIDLPLNHFHDDDARTHYQNFEVRIPDAPRDDEMLVCLVGATGGRPHPRVGSRATDERELGRTYDGRPVTAGTREP